MEKGFLFLLEVSWSASVREQLPSTVCQLLLFLTAYVPSIHSEQGVTDLVLDVPRATDMLSHFVARAVIDDVLAPSFTEDTHAGNLNIAHLARSTLPILS